MTEYRGDPLSAAARLLNDPCTPVGPFIRALSDKALSELAHLMTELFNDRTAVHDHPRLALGLNDHCHKCGSRPAGRNPFGTQGFCCCFDCVKREERAGHTMRVGDGWVLGCLDCPHRGAP